MVIVKGKSKMNRYLNWGDFVYTRKHLLSNFNSIYDDFMKRFHEFGKKLGISSENTQTIGNKLFDAMASDRRTYHSPLHILAMFDFAKLHNISIELWEENAIWFHDAIYEFEKGEFSNEVNSAFFMKNLMRTYLTSSDLERSIEAIHETEKHLLENTNPDYNKIMDLDLCSFANPDVYEATARLLREEFSTSTDEQFEKGRRFFIGTLKGKGFIYRSQFFKDNFENIAMENINRTLGIN